MRSVVLFRLYLPPCIYLTNTVGSFLSGKLGDTYHAPTVVAIGLFGSGLCVMSLAAGIYANVESYSYSFYHTFFLGIWLIHGLFQSTGGPVGTAIMGNWFGSKNRGWIFGTWTCHQYVGNITAAVVATAILKSSLNWTWALIIPSLTTFLWSVWMWAKVPEKPADVGLLKDDDVKHEENKNKCEVIFVPPFCCMYN